MNNPFLKAKHWQLFTLLTGSLIIVQFIWFLFFISNFNLKPNPIQLVNTVTGFLELFNSITLIVLIATIALFGWYWSIAIGLKNKLPKSVNLNFRLYTILLLTSLCISTLFVIMITNFIQSIGPDAHFNPLFLITNSFTTFLLLQCISIFCYFYSIHFTAKVIKSVELQKEARFNDFVEEFFLLWFHFVGVWMLQPKIQNMLNGNSGKIKTSKTEAPKKISNSVRNTSYEDELDDLI